MLLNLLLILFGAIAHVQGFSKHTQCGQRPFCEAYEKFCTAFTDELRDYVDEELPWLAKITVSEVNPVVNTSVDCVAIVLSLQDMIVNADCIRSPNATEDAGLQTTSQPTTETTTASSTYATTQSNHHRPFIPRNKTSDQRHNNRNVSGNVYSSCSCEGISHFINISSSTKKHERDSMKNCTCRTLHFDDNSTRTNFTISDIGKGLLLVTLAHDQRLDNYTDKVQPSCVAPSSYDEEEIEMQGVICGFRKDRKSGNRQRYDGRRDSGKNRRSETRELGRKNEERGTRSRQGRITFSCRNITFHKASTNGSAITSKHGRDFSQEFSTGAAVFRSFRNHLVLAGVLNAPDSIVIPSDCDLLKSRTEGRVQCVADANENESATAQTTITPISAEGSSLVPVAILTLIGILAVSLIAHCVYMSRERAPYTEL